MRQSLRFGRCFGAFVWAVESTSAPRFFFSWLCICASLALSQGDLCGGEGG